VLRLVGTGLSNQEVARELYVTVGTVKKHLNNVFGKLGVKSRTQAVARARELKLLSCIINPRINPTFIFG
jgi:LuxR family maltose regulon positive regulatory protein